MIIQNMAYVQQIQKQETEKPNIVNPETKLTKKGTWTSLSEIQIPSSFRIMPSPLTDDLVLRMTTGSHSFASDARGMGMKNESKDQGHLIVANGGGA